MFFQAVTLFPEMFAAITAHGVSGRALQQGLWRFEAVNPRRFADNRLGYIDDRPFGGGPGMIMMAEPLQAALQFARKRCDGDSRVVYLSPQGAPLTHTRTAQLAQHNNLILLCGRYEGVDERVLQSQVDEEISIGDFVVSGGELPAMMLMDAVLRLLPGVLADSRSAEQDSFADGLLDCPHYTRPAEFCGMSVPEILLSGNHAKIAEWRLEQSLRRTLSRRPELLDGRAFTPQEARLLDKIQKEQANPYHIKENQNEFDSTT